VVHRAHWQQSQIWVGFFEARIKIADIKGINNAFWLTTDDNFEIDVAEATNPSYIHIGLQYWPPHNSTETHAGMGWGANFVENLSEGFHDIGVLRRPSDMVFEVDGEPVAAVITKAVKGPAAIRFSTALGDWAGGKVPDHPEGHGMAVQSFRAFAQE